MPGWITTAASGASRTPAPPTGRGSTGELLEPEAAQALADGDTILLGNLEVHFVREADEAIVFEEGPPDAQSITVKTAPRVKDLPSLIAALPSAPLTKRGGRRISRAGSTQAIAVLTTVSGAGSPP